MARENTPNIGLTYETDKNNNFSYDEDIKNNLIKADEEIGKLKYQVESPEYSAEQTVTTSIFSLDENAEYGQFSGELKGNSISVVEGENFSSDTGGYIVGGGYGSLALVDEELEETISIVSDTNRIEKEINYVVGNKYYIASRIKPKFDNVTYFKLGGDIKYLTVTANEYAFVSDILEPTNNTEPFRFYHRTGANYQVGDKIYYNDIMIIDLTSSGWADKTKEELDQMLHFMTTGTKSTNSVKLTSVNINLFDGKLESGTYTWAGGNKYVSSGIMRSVNMLRVKPNATYICNLSSAVFLYDINGNYLGLPNNRNNTFYTTAFTTTANTAYLSIGLSSSYGEDYNLQLQLEEGTTATDYVEHEESEVYYTFPWGEGRSIGDVHDTINDDGTADKKISDDISISGSDINSSYFSYANFDILYFDIDMSDAETDKIIVGGVTYNYTTTDSDDINRVNTWRFRSLGTGDYRLCLRIAKGIYTSTADAQANYPSNTLIYQLAEEIPHQLNITPLTCWGAGTTVYVEPYMSRGFTYSSGIVFDIPVAEIDSVEKVDTGETIDLDDVTLATDGLSITITGATDGEGYIVKAPIRTEESTIPTLTYSYPLNTAGALDSVIKATNTQSAILNDHEMMLLTLSLQILDLQNA